MKLLMILSLVVAVVHTSAQEKRSVHRSIDSIFSEYNSLKPGVAIAIVKDGKVDHINGYGLGNLEHKVPITSQTKFHVASVSKQFTAFAIYLLNKDGKLSFEDDVRKYITELPKYNKTITIKHLLAHTSGLRDQWALLTLAGWQMEDVITTEQIFKLLFSQKDLNFETGSQYGYSNSGYTLLAEIVSRISGMSFAEFTKDRIFIPLGMNNTLFNDDVHNVIMNKATSYELVKGKWIERKLNFSTAGATSLTTTVEDLAKWVSNFEKPIVGDEALIKSFNEISTYDNGNRVISAARPGDTTYHAKGQLHWKYKGLNAISHGGHDAGFRAVLTRFSEQKIAIITLSNNEHYQMLGKVLPVADIYLKDAFKASTDVVSPSPNTSPKKTEAFNNILTDYIGDYKSDELVTAYSIQVKDGKLVMRHMRLSDIILTPTGTDKFTGANGFAFEMNFIRENGTITGFNISNYGVKNLRFSKVM